MRHDDEPHHTTRCQHHGTHIIRHGEPALTSGIGMSPAAIMDACETLGWEGIVWWRDIYDPDCEKAKLKVRDMP